MVDEVTVKMELLEARVVVVSFLKPASCNDKFYFY